MPTDGSETSDYVVKKGLSVAKLLKRPVLGVYVIDYQAFEPYPQEGLLVDLRSVLEKDAQRALEALKKRGEAEGVKIETKVLQGHPEEEIVRVAKPTDLIVIGTHGRRGLSRLLLGSVAETVVRHATCPVLIIRKPSG